jgi:hypothetical protein
MADTQAIGAVSSVLQQVLTDGLGGVAVGLKPPDRMDTAGGTSAALNLYLYQVERSGRWQNLPMPNAGRATEAAPPLALVLRYLLTAFGEDDLAVQDALERAISLLTDSPILAQQKLDEVVPASSLARQGEPVRLTLINMESRDLFHLWSTFQSPYRTSVLFEAEVVLVESRTSLPAPPPVLKRGTDGRDPTADASLVPPFPTIDTLSPAGGLALGERVTLTGHHLDGVTAVRFTPSPSGDPIYVNVAAADQSEAAVAVALDPAAGAWRAGTYSVVALTPEACGGPGPPAVESNAASLDVVPRLVSVGVNGASPVTDPGPGSGPTPTPAPTLSALAQGTDRHVALAVTADPAFAPGQRALLLLNGQPVPPDAPPAGAATPSLTFTAVGVAAGTYWLRLRVDGVDSRLVDRTAAAPAYRAFRVEVT